MKKLLIYLVLSISTAYGNHPSNVKFVKTMLKERPILLNKLTKKAGLVDPYKKNYLHTIFDTLGGEHVVETMGEEFDYRELANSIKDFSNQKNQLNLYKELYSKLPKDYLRWRIVRTPRSLRGKDAKVIANSIYSLTKKHSKIKEYIDLPSANSCASECKHHPDGIFKNVSYPMKSLNTCVKNQRKAQYVEDLTNASKEVAQVWNIFNPDFSVSTAKLASLLKLPMVLSFPITPSLDKAPSNGYVQYLGSHEDNRGGHAAYVVAVVDNIDLPATAPKGPGGGYFVIKNSWGACWMDGGYIYLPITWVKAYAKSLTIVPSI